MTPRDARAADVPLISYEIPDFLVRPAVKACRTFNSALDFVFYDVPTLRAELHEAMPLDAISAPEGCLLLIDPGKVPHAKKFDSVREFLDSRSSSMRRKPSR